MAPNPTPTTSSWSGQRLSFPAKVRRRVLARAQGCALAIPGICAGTPTQVDHITPHAEALLAGWTPDQIDHIDNAQAVCSPCHAVKTAAEQARGRARARDRRPSQRRPAERHPGLT